MFPGRREGQNLGSCHLNVSLSGHSEGVYPLWLLPNQRRGDELARLISSLHHGRCFSNAHWSLMRTWKVFQNDHVKLMQIFFFFCFFKYSPSRQAVTGGTQRACRFVPQMSRPVINPVTTEQDAACFEKDLDCSPSKWELFYFWSFAPNRRLIVMETGICIFRLWTCLEVLVPIRE